MNSDIGKSDQTYKEVLNFWFRELTPEQWFRSGKDLDGPIRERFGALVEIARSGELDDWATTAEGRLALILLLDQFPRHVYRDDAKAYLSDEKAQQLSLEGIDSGMDGKLTFSGRHFFYMPLMHAENPTLQDKSVERFTSLHFTSLKDYAGIILEVAKGHRSIVQRFGRFPHRNEILNRPSTQEEGSYLVSDENVFGSQVIKK